MSESDIDYLAACIKHLALVIAICSVGITAALLSRVPSKRKEKR